MAGLSSWCWNENEEDEDQRLFVRSFIHWWARDHPFALLRVSLLLSFPLCYCLVSVLYHDAAIHLATSFDIA